MNTADRHNLDLVADTTDLVPFVANPAADEWVVPDYVDVVGALPGVVGPRRLERTARVLGVCDGDTLRVQIEGWREADIFRPLWARLFGFDAPELHDARVEIKETALAARNFLRAACADAGNAVRLVIRARDKYGGRVVADFLTPAGIDLGQQLRQAGLVRPYTGTGGKPW